MNVNTLEMVQSVLALALAKDRQGLVNLMKKNGINIPDDATDDELIVAALNASRKSRYFKTDLTNYLANLTLSNREMFTSFTAEDEDFFNTSGDRASARTDVFTLNKSGATTTTTGGSNTTTTKRTKGQGWRKIGDFFKSNILTPENINAGISTGLTLLSNKSQQRADTTAANLAAIQMQKDSIMVTTGNKPADKKGKTLTYVLIGVGVLVIGLSAYFLMNRKK